VESKKAVKNNAVAQEVKKTDLTGVKNE